MKYKETELETRIRKIREKLKSSNSKITDDVKKELQNLTLDKLSNNIKLSTKNLENIVNTEDIISNLENQESSDILNNTIDNTLSSLLDPVKVVFAREVARYIDSISIDKTITKVIPRTVSKRSIKTIKDGKFVPAEDSDELVINPEFKQLLSSGYKPADAKMPLKEDSDTGTIESDFVKSKDGSDNPGKKQEKIKTTISKPAGLFIESFGISDEEITFKQNPLYTEINLRGDIKTNIESKKLLSKSIPNPKWSINYREQSGKYYLTIKNQYKYSKKSGILPNNKTYKFVGNSDKTSLSQDSQKKIKEIQQGDECNVEIGEDLFAYLLNNKLDGLIDNPSSNFQLTGNQKKQFNSFLKNNFKFLIKSITKDLFTAVTKNRLLENFKFENSPSTGLEEEDSDKSNLILLNLVNFIPELNDELKDCGKNIHPLNFDEILNLMKVKFKSIGMKAVTKQKCDTPEEEKDPSSEAIFLGSSVLLVRIFAFEYLLKNLFVFDELGYSDKITNSPLVKEHLSLIIKKELEDLGIYEEIENTIEENYDLLKKQKLIIDSDENNINQVFSSIVDNKTYQQPSDKVKNLVNSMMRKTTNYVKKLLGSQKQKPRNTVEILSNNEVYNLLSYKNFPIANPDRPGNYIFNSSDILNNISELSRFKNNLNKKSKCFFIVEKYVKNINFNNNSNLFDRKETNKIKNYIDSKGFNNINSFQEYSNNLASLIRNPIEYFNNQNQFFKSSNTNIDNLSTLKDLFNNKPSMGLRLLLVINDEKSIPIDNSDNKKFIEKNLNGINFIQQNKKSFTYSDKQNGTVSIRENKLSSNRTHVFYDYNEEEEKLYHYNSIIIEEVDVPLNFEEIVGSNLSRTTQKQINRNLNILFARYKQELFNKLSNSVSYELIIKKCLMTSKITNLMSFYSYSALSNEEMETLFKTSKKKIKNLINAGKNIDNYNFKNEDDLAGGSAGLYQMDFKNIGNPAGSGNSDILQFLVTTPILILKGLTQVMDPNIAIASQIVNAASAGLLFPKFITDDKGNTTVEYPGDPFILPTVLASMALLPVNLLPPPFGIGPPVTPIPGMLYWVLEPLLWKLPYFQDLASKSTTAKNLKNEPKYRGLDIGSQNFSCNQDQDDI